MNLITELKRRKVIRVAVVYTATAFAVLQAADIMLPRMGVPDWAMSLVVALAVLGFPIALVLTWALELTPEGIRRTESVPVDETIRATPPPLGKRTVFVAALPVAVGIGLGAGWFLRPLPMAPMPTVADVPVVTDAPAEQAPIARSIAVLAFDNMSPDPDNAFFAEGISEELLNILAGIDGLHVASRSSAFSFRGTNTPIPEIARVLDVAHVLEGSVRRQGERVRITAQLIRADTDGHLWSRAFDRDLTDIFRVQEEIAQQIADALSDILGTKQVEVVASTDQLGAYDRFLSGRARFHQRTELDAAAEDLQYAVVQDPDFVEAWIYLGATLHAAIGYPSGQNIPDREARLAAALERATELAPDHPVLLSVRGIVEWSRGDRITALALSERAGGMRTPDSTPAAWYGLALLRSGYRDEAVAVLQRAVRVDPMVGVNHAYLAYALMHGGDFEAGERHARLAVERGWRTVIFSLVTELAARGERARAVEIAAEMTAGWGLQESYLALLADPAAADRYLEAQQPRTNTRPDETLIHLGRTEAFLDQVEHHLRQMAVAVPHAWLRSVWLPSAHAVREHPRYFAIAAEMGLVELWEARGYPPGCVRVDSPAGDRLDCPGMRR